MTHNHNQQVNSGNVFKTVLLNAVITLAEFIGGILSNSLALLSDAVHNLSDTLSIAFSYTALRISKKKASEYKTYGYKRFEIIAAFINSGILIAISLYLFYEAYGRLMNPREISSGIMLIVAVIGFLGNLISIFLLNADSRYNLNIKAAFLHLMGDTLSSVGVIIGGISIYIWEIYWIDPLITFIIGIVIIWHSVKIFRESYHILMQGTPESIDLTAIKNFVESYPDVLNIHHIHSWKLNDTEIHFEGHIDLAENLKINEADTLRENITDQLHERFGIAHATLQLEYDSCNKKSTIVR